MFRTGVREGSELKDFKISISFETAFLDVSIFGFILKSKKMKQKLPEMCRSVSQISYMWQTGLLSKKKK